MQSPYKFGVIVLILALIVGCNSEEDCTKTMLIPQGYFVGNQFYSYDQEREVPCDFPEPIEFEQIEPVKLENFSYEVVNFQFTPDIGGNISRLQFEIKLNNPNNFAVTGVPILTTAEPQGFQFVGSYSTAATIACKSIQAQSTCTLTYDKTYPFNPDSGIPSIITLVKVEYYLTN